MSSRRKLSVIAALMAAVLALSAPAIASASSSAALRNSGHGQTAAAAGTALPLPLKPAPSGNLAPLGGGTAQSPVVAVEQAGALAARRSGKPVTVASLTSQTSTVTANPGGGFTLTEYTLPVRVRQARGWVPVDTVLRRSRGGLSPAAVPGDAVTFSRGGDGAAAVISAAGTNLAVSWPGRLPVPVVSGSSATYRDVLPGVDLVLTATSGEAGGFSEVLVVRDAAAARDPGLARLALRVSGQGARLQQASGGGLYAPAGGHGYYAAPVARMWDSPARPGSTSRPGAAAVAAAQAVGASLASAWSPPVSSVTEPGAGARVAPVGAIVSGQGSVLSLAPDATMLRSPGTRFPVYIDPSFQWYPATGSKQAYDPVQSENDSLGDCQVSHYNDTNYADSPVGFDNWQAGPCQFGDTDYAYYQVAVPSVLTEPGVHLHSASVQAAEAYSSSCTVSANVTLTWTGGIGKGTGWGNKPGAVPGDTDVTDNVGPDYYSASTNSCNTQFVEHDGVTVPAPFNVLPDISDLMTKGWPSFTFRLWEPGNNDRDDHKQFTDNPDLQVTYNDTPSIPGGLKESATASGSGGLDCDTAYKGSASAPPPIMGKTASVSGPFLWATYNDLDGDSVSSTIDYWVYGSNPTQGGTATAGPDLSTGSTAVAAQIPGSFTTNLANGTVIAWKAQASDGTYASAWSPTCYFAVFPKDPDPPSMSASATQAPVDSTMSFTITQSGGPDTADPAAKFVWSLDSLPPASNPPAAQTCTTTAATSECTKIIGGVATLTLVVPSPGPHDLWVYEVDAAGNDSAMTNAPPSGMTSTFSGAGDPQVDYASGSSLGANFGAALAADGNTMIAASSGKSCGAATGDGSGTGFDAANLTSAGWGAGKTVTVDGASFTLPGFGGCGADNVLAANQQIGAGPSGAQGSALVFLATSTDAYAQVPGLATGSPDAGRLSLDATVPSVPGGVAVTGTGCTNAVALNVGEAGCVPASGTVNYASGCAATSYYLTVPDWQAGPADIAAVTLPEVIGTSGLSAKTANIYAFAVPVNPSCVITSVDLPDVGNAVNVTVAGSGSTAVTEAIPGLHLFGMALRNTTTATPEADGTAVSSPAGQAWTGAFESPVEDAYSPPAGTTWGDQTIRIGVSTNLSVSSGAQLRIRLSNPGFISADGPGPLQIGAATIAPASSGPTAAQPPVALSFGATGAGTVTVPEGGDVYSNPLTLNFPVTAGQQLLISLWLQNSYLPALPENSWASGGQLWIAPAATPNQTADQDGAPFTGTGALWAGATAVLTGVDVTTQAVNGSPGMPTVVVIGDNVIDGGTSRAVSDASDAPSQRLAGQIAAQGLASGYGVVDAGIEAGQVLNDGTASGGVSLLARLDRDILAEPDVGTIILDEGLEDLLQAAGSTVAPGNLEDAYQAIENQLTGFGVNWIITTLTPCSGYTNSAAGDSCSSRVDAGRQDVNTMVENTPPFPGCYADLDAAVSNGATPEALASTAPDLYNAGDDANLTLAGYYALASPVFNGAENCTLLPALNPLPAVP